MNFKKGHTGTSLGAIETSPAWEKKVAKRKKRQEKRWAAKAGPVVVSQLDKESDDND